VSPQPRLYLALGLLIGLAIGIGTTLLRESLDTSVRTVDELQREGLHPLGTVPFDNVAAHEALADGRSSDSAYAQAFLQIRTALHFAVDEGIPRSLCVTSSVAGEGKSVCAANIAAVAADAGMRTLLIDCDLRDKGLGRYLDLQAAAGLAEVVAGSLGLEDAVTQLGDTGRLFVLATGSPPAEPASLLGSPRMREFLSRVEQHFDFIVLDTPPVLPVADPTLVASQVSGVVFVVRQGATRVEEIRRALDMLGGVKAEVVGAVLNMAPMAASGRVYATA